MESLRQGGVAPHSIHQFVVEQEHGGSRADAFITSRFAQFSRSFFQKLIDSGRVTLNGKVIDKPSRLVGVGDTILVHFPPVPTFEPKVIPDTLDVSVVHTDANFLIINKPAHLLVHPTNVSSSVITLVDWLIAHFSEIAHVGSYDRPGIVHRLDKDTTGLLIVPRNNFAHALFGSLFRNRLIKKTYIAVVQGHPEPSGTVDFPIGRDPFVKNRMTHRNPMGRPALTHYKVLKYMNESALVELSPVTGRTHQLRVHCAALGHPIIGDGVYGEQSPLIAHQALHAMRLEFEFDGVEFVFHQEPPKAFERLVNHLESAV